MPKQIIVIMEGNQYPFGESEECNSDLVKILVRKKYSTMTNSRSELLEKANLLKSLNDQHLIHVQSIMEEEESVHFMFEYVPIRMETWISNINDQFIENFRDQLIKFSAFLANHAIKIEFQLSNIGMNEHYGAKYFVGLDFIQDHTINKEKLKSHYIRSIFSLFKPYVAHNIKASPSNAVRHDEDDYFANVSQSRVEKPVPPLSPKHEPAHESKKYYSHIDQSVDSQNEKILQEFMEVLDNDNSPLGNEEFTPVTTKTQTPFREEVIWKEEDDLRRRIESAIAKSKVAIQKFKKIKETPFKVPVH